MRLCVAGVAAFAACGGRAQPSSHLAAAGAVADDGTGQLARASVRVTINSIAAAGEPERPTPTKPSAYWTSNVTTSSTVFGGALYGGAKMPRLTLTPVNRTVPYAVASIGGAGAVVGAVTWSSASASHPSLQTACGSIDDSDKGHRAGAEAAEVVVYLEGLARGRAVEYIELPVSVGGTMHVKHCALLPRVQVMAPVPAPMMIDNDDHARTVRVHAESGTDASIELASGGARAAAMRAGITEISDVDGALTPAWVVAPGHPYAALVDEHGRFRIDEVVPGRYTVVAWHAPAVLGVQDGRVVMGEPLVTRTTVTVSSDSETRVTLALPGK